MKVIDIDELRKNKLNRKENSKQKQNENKQYEPEKTEDDFFDFDILEDTIYFYAINSFEVSFDHLYVKSLIENTKKNRGKVIKAIEVSNKKSIDYLEETLDKNDEKYEGIVENLNNQKKLMIGFVDNLKTPQDLDDMFQIEESETETEYEYFFALGFVLTIIMIHSYSEIDYYRMVKNDWLTLSLPISEFMSSPLYIEIKESVSEIVDIS